MRAAPRRPPVARVLVALLAGLAALPLAAKEADPWHFTATKAESAGPDFALQGEYRGEAADGTVIAARIGALGDGALRLAFHEGGFPGETGWRRVTTVEPTGKGQKKRRNLPDMTQEIYGRSRDGKLVFDCCPGYPVVVTLADGVLSGRNEHGQLTLKRSDGGDATAPAGLYAGSAPTWNRKAGVPTVARIAPAGAGGCWRLVMAQGETPEALKQAEADVAEAIARVEGVELFGWRRDGGADFPVATGRAWGASLNGGELSGRSEDGRTFVLRKVDRTSPTIGAKPPQGATVLFDGSSADAWEVGDRVRNPIVDFRGERALTPVGRTKRSFAACDIHIEYATAFQPWFRKWYRGNSGVYALGRTEITIGDSFGWRTDGERWACGGIFGHCAPAVNACLPPMAWQTLDIEVRFIAGSSKISVRHNGVPTVTDQDAPATAHAIVKDPGAGGPLYLERPQGEIVFFRNIWVLER